MADKALARREYAEACYPCQPFIPVEALDKPLLVSLNAPLSS